MAKEISKEQREYYRALDKRPVEMVCDCCGKRFVIQYRQARNNLRKGNNFICPSCKEINATPNDSIRQQVLEDREKCILEMNASKNEIKMDAMRKLSETLKSKSNEEKEIRKKKVQETWAAKNEDDEKKRERSEKKRQWWASRTPEQLAELKRSMSKAQHEYVDNMSDEEKKKRSEAGKKSAVTRWENKSEEEIAADKLRISEKSKEMWAKRSPEKRKEVKDAIAKGRKKYWDNMTPEEMEKISEKKKKWWDNLSQEEFEKQCLRYAIDFNNNPGVHGPEQICEIDFINQLQIFGIDYIPQFYNISKDSSFNEIFHENLKSGSSRVNPYHRWDILVKTKSGNVFIDIDGSIHNRVNKDTIVSISTAFYDSQRPYQTDGYEAYSISCPNDKLDVNSDVINIKSGEKLKVSGLLGILSYMNMSNKDQKALANNI